jgi:hypothetical protein
VLLQHVETLEKAIRDTEAGLLIIDPLSAYLGHTDSHRDAEVRGLFSPIAAMAERAGAAVLGVMHLGKSAQRPAIYRAVGSIAFTAFARSVLAVAADPEQDTRRIVVPVKSNLSPGARAIAYVLTDSRLIWDANPVPEVHVDELLNAVPGDRSERRGADAWLREVLANGPMRSNDILAEGEQEGLSRRTLFRAKKRLGIVAKRGADGDASYWSWFLPP